MDAKKRAVSALMFLCLGTACFGLGAGTGSALTLWVHSSGYFAETPPRADDEYALKETPVYESAAYSYGPEYHPVFTASSAASGTSGDAVSVVKGTANSVVSINVLQNKTYNFGYWQLPGQTVSAGSGIIFSEDSEKIYILTNNHVVDGATGVTISIDDEKTAAAHFVGSGAESDLAVISVDKPELKKAGITDYTLAVFGNSDALEVGERVVAIGNAHGEGKSATQGIVSALNKHIVTSAGNEIVTIQTDAAINPGNSGGALVNASSQVIGINTAKLSDYAGGEGMGYSIPSNTAKAVVEGIMKNKGAKEPYIGISLGVTVTEEIMKSNNLPSIGVYVNQVLQNSPAAKAGIRAGDIISSFNGTRISDVDSLSAAVSKTSPGDKVEVLFYRAGQQRAASSASVTIGEKPGTTDF